jgi:CRP-like cAMP-binding protein
MTDPTSIHPGEPPQSLHGRRIAEIPQLLDLAAALLRTPSALAEMSTADARSVVSYMRLIHYPAGALMFREGDASNTSYLLLVLSGEVKVEAIERIDGEALDIGVLGPGNVIGEMGLIDGAPRSATCTAVTTVQAGGMSRNALDRMLAEQPAVAAKLMVALSQRLADRLRALGEQLGIYARLARQTRQELDRLKGSGAS